MKYLLIVSIFILTACGAEPKPTEAEERMAAMMGITVEELRLQTPEEHMEMMMNMHNN
jgi:hypothetical protein